MSLADDLHECTNPLCGRLTTAMYCCHACSDAHEGKYEIHETGPLAHSEFCDQRHAFRQASKAEGTST